MKLQRCKPPAETKLRAKDPMKAWVRETTGRLTFTMCERQNSLDDPHREGQG